jgi:hypothetical protein
MNLLQPSFTRLLLLLIAMVFLPGGTLYGKSVPFSTNHTHITIWNGRDYEPFFLKGMNMGVAVPGKFPGEMLVSRAQYSNWFQLIKDAGFNSLRLYTLHYPHFYEVLDSFNLANPHNPLFFFQGVWLEEEYEGYYGDLLFLNETFENEIQENVDCVHGNRVISARLGKAWGTYAIDVSKWNIGYIIGREVHPGEVMTTNKFHPGNTSFSGVHFSIESVNATEAWITSKLDYLVDYEFTNHGTQRPVSFSSWPTQDPLSHPEEWNRWEDTTSVDLSGIKLINAPAGFFISYHAYPYYPDFVNYGFEYQDYTDDFGPNSYLGYLTHLKTHYPEFPLIIAEYGVPSSWGLAHYSTSGMHHGGFDEYEQGENNIRLLKSIESANCGGGMQFAWIDEWFKRTWVTDHIDYLMYRRILWHNVTAAEQNFGLLAFQRPLQMKRWEEFCPDCHIKSIDAAADYDFLHFKIHLKELPGHLDEIWIAIDTYDANLGESILPTGVTLENRAEFALHITNYSAKLYVTQAYDLYGIFHGISESEQKYRSTASDGDPWNIVRWKVNEFDQDIQYIGNLKVNYGFLPVSSRDAVTIHPDHIDIRIPWSLIHFVDPSEYVVFHDDRNTYQPEDTISDGVALSISYKGEDFHTTERFLWEKWNTALDVEEVIKGSYWVMKDRLQEFNNRVIAINDTLQIIIDGEPAKTSIAEGVLANDFDMDGNFMQALLLTPPDNGRLQLNPDGSLIYEPTNAKLSIYEDSFTYTVFDGLSLSEPAMVKLYVDMGAGIDENQNSLANLPEFLIYPNPASDHTMLKLPTKINHVYLFDMQGRMLMLDEANDLEYILDVSHLKSGIYLVAVQTAQQKFVKPLQIY